MLNDYTLSHANGVWTIHYGGQLIYTGPSPEEGFVAAAMHAAEGGAE